MSKICGRISINNELTSMLQVLKLFTYMVSYWPRAKSTLYLHPVSLISNMTFGDILGTSKSPCVAIHRVSRGEYARLRKNVP